MFASNRAKPKTVRELQFISHKKTWEVAKAIDVLVRNGLVVVSSPGEWCITNHGHNSLRLLAAEQPNYTIGDDSDMALNFGHWKERDARNKRSYYSRKEATHHEFVQDLQQ